MGALRRRFLGDVTGSSGMASAFSVCTSVSVIFAALEQVLALRKLAQEGLALQGTILEWPI